MTDKTTMGITAAPEEVEAVLHNLCGYHLAERDPVFRYTVLTREQVLYDALVASIRRERGRALAELAARGHKLTEIAELTGLGSRQRVQRLIQQARLLDEALAEVAVAEVQAASREFDERLAAVEATLDEVVSGVLPAESLNVVAKVTDEFAEVMAKNEPYIPAHNGPYVPAGNDPHIQARNDSYVLAGNERYVDDEPDTDQFDVTGIVEATQVMPTLTAVLHPTRELVDDELPWWRRNRDTTGAA
jgi:hypothetical protein